MADMQVPWSRLVRPAERGDLSWQEYYHKYGHTSVLLGPQEEPARTEWLARLNEEFRRHVPVEEPAEGRIAQFTNRDVKTGVIMYNFGQTALQWEIRQLCMPYLAELYGVPVEEMISSFDGGGFLQGKAMPVGETFADWLHHDHPTETKDGRPSYDLEKLPIQGLVVLKDCTFEGAGLIVLDSRETFEPFLKENPLYRSHTNVPRDHPMLKDLPWVKVVAKAGSLILWHPFMFHQNCPGQRLTEEMIPDDRLALYCTGCPSSFLTPEELARHISDYEQGHQTGHHAFGERARSNHLKDGAPPLHPDREHYQVTGLARRFVGYDQ